MRFPSVVALAALAIGCASATREPLRASTIALAPAPPDSTLPTGKRARMWTAERGWLEGYLIRFLPAPERRCLAVYAPKLSGALVVAEIDSLQVDRFPGFGVQPPTARDLEAAPTPVWQPVSVADLRSREPHCT